MADNEKIYSQFAKKFSNLEELEAFKKELANSNERKQQLAEIAESATDQTSAFQVVSPTVSPNEEAAKSYTYPQMLQNSVTNALSKVQVNPKKAFIDLHSGETGLATVTKTLAKGTFTLATPLYPSFKTSGTAQLLDLIILAYTANGARSSAVSIPLKEYMARRGLDASNENNVKQARTQIKKYLEELFNARISFKTNDKKSKDSDFHDVRIIGSKGISNGNINVTLDETFQHILKAGHTIMPYPLQLLLIDGRRTPNGYYLGRKIAEHKNINAGKKNEDLISVKTLLDASPEIPTYEDVMSGDKAVSRRIIKPFERDMNALNGMLSWHYCHSNDKPLTDAEKHNFDYSTFSNLLVKIDWVDYPDQTARLERKAEKIKQAMIAKAEREQASNSAKDSASKTSKSEVEKNSK